jgi:hypothetical protein
MTTNIQSNYIENKTIFHLFHKKNEIILVEVWNMISRSVK